MTFTTGDVAIICGIAVSTALNIAYNKRNIKFLKGKWNYWEKKGLPALKGSMERSINKVVEKLQEEIDNLKSRVKKLEDREEIR